MYYGEICIYPISKKKIPLLFSCLIIGGLFTGCSDPLEELITENTDAITTKAIVTIVCSDSYIGAEINGVYYEAYNGTHCWAEGGGGGGFPSGLNAGGKEPYIANGYPTSQGGGSVGFLQGTAWTFTFNKLKNVYGPYSTLNLMGKNALDDALAIFPYRTSQYMDLYDKLKTKLDQLKIKLSFKIDPSIPNPSQYLTGSKTIRFQGENSITFDNLSHEFVHAVQHLCYYGENMSTSQKNCEFEAYVFCDLANHLESPDLPIYKGLLSGSTPGFDVEYILWIDSLTTMGYFPKNQATRFNQLCRDWSGPGSHFPTFTPRILQDLFNKPNPPYNPNLKIMSAI